MLLGKVVIMPILCWLGLCKDIYEDASSPSMHFVATSMMMVPPHLLKYAYNAPPTYCMHTIVLLGTVVIMPILCWLGLCKDIFDIT